MKNMFLLLGAAALAGGCQVTDSQTHEEVWSGTVPPLYWRYDTASDSERANLVFPLVWFKDSGAPLYSVLFGWNAPETYSYWLTPLVSRQNEGKGIIRHDFPLIGTRFIDTDSHPEAASFDGSFFPLFTVETPTRTAYGSQERYGALSFFGMYEESSFDESVPANAQHPSYTRSSGKFSYGGYTQVEGKTNVPGQMEVRELKRDIIPFWISGRTMFAFSDTRFGGERSFDFIFPCVYLEKDNSALPARDENGNPRRVCSDMERTLIFPLFDRARSGMTQTVQGPVMLWYDKEDADKGVRQSVALWLFDRRRTPGSTAYGFLWRFFRVETGDDPKMHVFFIPIPL